MCGRPVGSILLPGCIDQETAKRSTSASGYYTPNEDLPNLLVLTGAHALKVPYTLQRRVLAVQTIDFQINLQVGRDGIREARGVVLEVGGKTFTVNAQREVILSAGTSQPP